MVDCSILYIDVSVKSRYRTASRFALTCSSHIPHSQAAKSVLTCSLGTPTHLVRFAKGWCYMPDSYGICHQSCGACHEVYLPLLCKHMWEKTYDTYIIYSYNEKEVTDMCTYATAMENKGIEIGREQGREAGKRDLVEEMLRSGLALSLK